MCADDDDDDCVEHNLRLPLVGTTMRRRTTARVQGRVGGTGAARISAVDNSNEKFN